MSRDVPYRGMKFNRTIKVGGELASSLTSREMLFSYAMEKELYSMCTDMPYEIAVKHSNVSLGIGEEDLLKSKATTICKRVNKMGQDMLKVIETETDKVLEESGFNHETLALSDNQKAQWAGCVSMPCVIPPTTVPPEYQDYIDRYNSKVTDDRFKIKDEIKIRSVEESNSDQVKVCLDGVVVPEQKETRDKEPGPKHKKKKERLELQCGHIAVNGKCRAIVSPTLFGLFKTVLAFLLQNKLLETNRIVFITDGARCLRAGILKYFNFRLDKVIILDWFHLRKRITELCSMAFRRKKEKKTYRCTILRMLWVGNVKDALEYIKSLKEQNCVLKDEKYDELVNYLTDRESCIPCYALRSKFGLPISSNAVEKTNDTLVSKREKGRGMSFSKKGSYGLAVVKAFMENGDFDLWQRKQSFTWEMHPMGGKKTEKLAA